MVMAIDPGLTTGWAIGKGQDLLVVGEGNWDRALFELDNRIWTRPFLQRVIIERFDLVQLTNDALVTIKLCGKIEYICDDSDIPFIYVNRVDKKKFIKIASTKVRQAPIVYREQGATHDAMPHAADAEAIRLYDLEYGTWQ